MVPALSGLPPAAWDAVAPPAQPFLSHAFLAGLEGSGSVGTPASGWLPQHLVARRGGRVVGALPLYAKLDSFGEYVFDWAWAEGAARAGLAYYPKLVAAVPFTPVTGARLLVAPGADAATVESALVDAAWALAGHIGASGVHVLFCGEAEAARWRRAGFHGRQTLQFQWHRRPGWTCFDDHLAALRAPARKQVRQERRRAAGHGLEHVVRRGDALDDAAWQALHDFYMTTVDRRGGAAYLTPAFFHHLRAHLAGDVVAALALADGEPVAGALFLCRGDTMWGRYWGAHRDYDALHFELCYHLPIEWGLPRGIAHIEAGAQGLHKHKRGLCPTVCHSVHRLSHPALHQAVGGAVAAEGRQLALDLAALRAHSPFRAATD